MANPNSRKQLVDSNDKLDDSIWFYFFDENTLVINKFIQKLDGEIFQGNSFNLISFVQQLLSQSEEIKERVGQFKNQTQQIERNKIREGISYHYEAFIAHILENIDFYLRNEKEMIKLNLKIYKQHIKIIKDFQKINKELNDVYSKVQYEVPNYNDILLQKVEQEKQFYKFCQDYIAIEKLYCYDFWVFQSEKQRYYRYFCTCVRLFLFFFELAEYRYFKLRYFMDIYQIVYSKDVQQLYDSLTEDEFKKIKKHQNTFFSEKHFNELEQSQQDLETLFTYCFNESKYCLFQISKNYQEHDTNYLGLKLLTLLLNQLTEEYEKNRKTIMKIKTENFKITKSNTTDKSKEKAQSSKIINQSSAYKYDAQDILNIQKKNLIENFNCEFENVRETLLLNLKTNKSGLVEEFNNIINESKNKYDDIKNNQSKEAFVQTYFQDMKSNVMVKVDQQIIKESKKKKN
ncbi:hypothetical protein ABPG72_005334 [Tetrahymena utriculariae]